MRHPPRVTAPDAAIRLLTWGNLALWLSGGARFALGSWLALDLTDNPSAPVWMLIAEIAPVLCLAVWFGTLIDRLDRRRLAIAADAVRVLALLGVALLAATTGPHIVVLIALSVVMGACDQLSTPSRTALVRQHAPPGRLLSANARISVSTQLGSMAGVAAGGLTAGTAPLALAFTCLALGHALSGGMLVLLRPTAPLPAIGADSVSERPTLWSAAGYIRSAGGLASPFLVVILLSALIKTYNSLLPAYSRDVLGLSSTRFGALDAAFAVGGMTAGIILIRVSAARSVQRRAHLGLLLLAACTAAFAVSPGFALAALAYCGVGLAFQTLTVYMAKCQTLVPLQVYGRVFSSFALAGTVLILLLYAAVSAALQAVSPVAVYLLITAVLVGLAVIQARAKNNEQLDVDVAVPLSRQDDNTGSTRNPA